MPRKPLDGIGPAEGRRLGLIAASRRVMSTPRTRRGGKVASRPPRRPTGRRASGARSAWRARCAVGKPWSSFRTGKKKPACAGFCGGLSPWVGMQSPAVHWWLVADANTACVFANPARDDCAW